MVRVNKHSLYTSIREKPAASAAPCFEDACLKLCSVWCAKAKSAGKSVGWMLSAVTHKHGIRTAMPRPISARRFYVASQPVTVRDFCFTEVLHRHQTGENVSQINGLSSWMNGLDPILDPR